MMFKPFLQELFHIWYSPNITDPFKMNWTSGHFMDLTVHHFHGHNIEENCYYPPLSLS